jgi:transglutaminase-like putative cysteine protease
MAVLQNLTPHKPRSEPQAATLGYIPEGPAGTRATLDYMVKLARVYKTNLDVRNQAEQIVAGVREKDFWGEAAAIQAWVRDNIRFTQDINGIETIKTPAELLASGQGDCDDKSLLAATLLESIGHPARFVAVGYTPDGEFEHVYAETKIGDAWIGVETTENVPLGWKPETPTSIMVRHI